MNYYVYHRIVGDELSILFSYDNTLSTAFLRVRGLLFDISNSLPSITLSNHHEYLEMIGFKKKSDDYGISKIQKLFIDKGLCIDKVVCQEGDSFLFGLILDEDRRIPCPRIRGYVRYLFDSNHIELVSVLDGRIEKILVCICNS